jgi:hypothetical protein
MRWHLAQIQAKNGVLGLRKAVLEQGRLLDTQEVTGPSPVSPSRFGRQPLPSLARNIEVCGFDGTADVAGGPVFQRAVGNGFVQAGDGR